MLIVFSPVFVADTKIMFRYNFVAPLRRFTLETYKRKIGLSPENNFSLDK